MNKPNWNIVQQYIESGNDIIGVDEVGRGAWAGPVVAGAVILPPGLIIDGLNDSKLVKSSRRVFLDNQIRSQSIAFGIGWVSPAEVDANGLSWAVAESGRRAIADLNVKPLSSRPLRQMIVLDGKWNYLKDTHCSIAIVKADSLVPPVAAGSIIAKVARDNYMANIAHVYPGFGFEKNVGYGTAVHRQALQRLGPTSAHRMSYKPLKIYSDSWPHSQ